VYPIVFQENHFSKKPSRFPKTFKVSKTLKVSKLYFNVYKRYFGGSCYFEKFFFITRFSIFCKFSRGSIIYNLLIFNYFILKVREEKKCFFNNQIVKEKFGRTQFKILPYQIKKWVKRVKNI
jgi:hypothetical protein